MKVARFAYAGGEGDRIGILCAPGASAPGGGDDGIIDFSAAFQAYRLIEEGCLEPLCTSMLDLLEQGLFNREVFEKVLNFVSERNLGEEFFVSSPRLLAPINRPPKILALGRNYLGHARESGREAPPEPIVFCKASTSVIGPDEPVVCKKFLGRVDPELELAVVIGKEGSDIPAEKASDHVAGYTIVNDVTARDMQSADMKAANPWLRSKSIDTFCPMGPCILLADEAPEPVSLDIELRVNGEVRQKDNTANLLFKIPQLVEFISRHMTLQPGDIISTGTPAGIQAVFPGDVMECRVEKIGVLRNPVVG